MAAGTAGPSKKSYAQAVKESHPPRPARPAQNSAPITLRVDEEEDQWTDVSSMTSCSWPKTVDEEGTSSMCQGLLSRPVLTWDARREVSCVISSCGHDDRDRPSHSDDTDPEGYQWTDESVDTRAPHAIASEISRINRSRRLYRIYSPNCFECRFPERELKLWRRFPGARTRRFYPLSQ